MFQVCTGDRLITLNNNIEQAAKLFVAEKSYFDGNSDDSLFMTFDESKIAHAISDALLNFLESLDVESLASMGSDRNLNWHLSKSLNKVEPIAMGEVVELFPSDQKIAA
jgi:hypothetical protein